MTEQTITNYFKTDHERLDALFLQFQASQKDNPSKTKEYFREFKSGLERHIFWEEELLFPLFEKAVGMSESGPTTVMRYEHEGLCETLGNIHSKVRSGRFGAEAESAMLMAALSEHNRKEESILYPMIDKAVTEKDRDEIFNKMKSFPEKHSCCCSAHE